MHYLSQLISGTITVCMYIKVSFCKNINLILTIFMNKAHRRCNGNKAGMKRIRYFKYISRSFSKRFQYCSHNKVPRTLSAKPLKPRALVKYRLALILFFIPQLPSTSTSALSLPGLFLYFSTWPFIQSALIFAFHRSLKRSRRALASRPIHGPPPAK